jgi:hypothetical protein
MNYRNSNRQCGSRDEPSVTADWRRNSSELQAAWRKGNERKENEKKGAKERKIEETR